MFSVIPQCSGAHNKMIVQKSLEEAWKLKQTRPLGVGFMEQQLASISSLNSLQGIAGHPNITAPWAVLSMSMAMLMLCSYWLWEIYQESYSCFPACPSHANFAILFVLFVTHQNHQAWNTDTSDLVRTLDGRWHCHRNNMRNWKRLVFLEGELQSPTFCCLGTPCILSLKNSWFSGNEASLPNSFQALLHSSFLEGLSVQVCCWLQTW